jgi:hypothetical protein
MNCSEVRERVVPIKTAQGCTVVLTTHVCLKTYFVRDRRGELRPITTKTYIVKNLQKLRHMRFSEWMEQHGYPAMNSEKTIFMKHQGADFIIH